MMRTEHRAIENSIEVFTINRARWVYYRRIAVRSGGEESRTRPGCTPMDLFTHGGELQGASERGKEGVMK